MNTFLHQNEKKIRDRWQGSCKQDRDVPAFGMEIEQFLVYKTTGKTLPYAGRDGVEAILRELSPHFQNKILSEGQLIGLVREDLTITLEPAAQLEFSIRPCRKVREIMTIWRNMLVEIKPILERHGVEFAMRGYQIHSTAERLSLIPKKRYELMDRHFRSLGGLGVQMMRGTASIHVSVDYRSEAHMGLLYRVFYRLLPFLAYMTDNVPVYEGRENTMPLRRMKIWEETDPIRVDAEPFLEPDRTMTFDGYLRFLEQAPVIVGEKNGRESYDLSPIGSVMAEKALDREKLEHLTSMLFPMLRLKDFLEIRVADAMPPRETAAYLCLIKGIYLNAEAFDAYLGTLFAGDDRSFFAQCEAIRRDGMTAVFGGRTLGDVIGDIILMAQEKLTDEEADYLLAFRDPLMRDGHLMAAFVGNYRPTAVSNSHDLNSFTAWWIGENPEACLEDLAVIEETLKSSGLKAGGRLIEGIYPPKFYTEPAMEVFEELGTMAARIAVKTMTLYKKDEKFRRLFGFDRETEALIMIDSGLEGHLPILRADFFFDETTEQYRFCEFNTDGSSGMIENRELDRAFRRTHLAEAFGQYGRLESFDMFEPLTEAYTALYRQSPCAVEKPCFAIVDYLEKASSLDEFEVYRQSFEKRGIRAVIADIRTLRFDGEHLTTEDGQVIHAVYRRAVTSDILERRKEAEALLEAYRCHKVVLLGGFDTQIIHDKVFMMALQDDYALSLFTEEEQTFIRDHFPLTIPFNGENENRLDLIRNRRDYVLKPRSAYGSKGVIIGRDIPMLTWVETMCTLDRPDYLIQSYIEPWRSRHISDEMPVTVVKGVKTPQLKRYYNMLGVYVIDGRPSGLYTRVSEHRVIATSRGGHTAASYVFHPIRQRP